MSIRDTLNERLQFLKVLTPRGLKRLAGQRLSDTVAAEIPRAKKRIADLEQRYPSAGPRELAQRMIDQKKQLAAMVGGVSGIFGLASIPADLVVMAWLQIVLLVDIATLYKANLKAERPRSELLELLGYANGVNSFQRAGPKVLGKVAGVLFEKGGWATLGRAMPLVAAPVTAYINNRHIQSVGDEALRHYDGFGKARDKAKSHRSK